MQDPAQIPTTAILAHHPHEEDGVVVGVDFVVMSLVFGVVLEDQSVAPRRAGILRRRAWSKIYHYLLLSLDTVSYTVRAY